jgi:hypothetical protein
VAAEWIGRNRKERCIKRTVRERHIKERLGKPAPPAAGKTSAAAADKAERVCRPGKPAPPAAGETSEAVADKPERLCCPDKPAPPAAGETSAAVADKSERPCGQGKPTPLAGWRDQRGGGGQARAVEQARQARSAGGWRDQRGGSGQGRAAVQDGRLQDTEAHQSDPQMLPRVLSGSADNSGWLHRQGSRNNSGEIPLRDPGRCRHGVDRQAGQGLHQATLQVPEEKG